MTHFNILFFGIVCFILKVFSQYVPSKLINFIKEVSDIFVRDISCFLYKLLIDSDESRTPHYKR